MSDTAFRANIIAVNPPTVMGQGEKRKIEIKVKNASQVEWITSGIDPNDLMRGEDDDKYRINLGNHWLDTDGKTVINDDGRASLPESVKPNETTTVSLGINAPKNPGDYILELDLVQENVAWFVVKSSETARYKIKVE